MMHAISHQVPHGSLPKSAMKEELSVAYLHMLASATGLTVGLWSQDYDCRDVTLSSSVDYSPDLHGPRIDVQLKCTGQLDDPDKDYISWSLDCRSYKKISNTNRSSPILFCVLVAPSDVGHWLIHDQAGLLVRSQMYWKWGHNFPPLKDDQASQTVRLVKANRLNPQVLLDLMKEASKWTPIA